MPTTEQILSELEPVFRDVLDIPTLTLHAALSAKDLEEWDSLNHIRIISTTEQRFGVHFTSAEIDALHNVGEFAALIASKLIG